MKNRSKKHHYVPQSILRRFSSNPEGTTIHVFDKTNLTSFLSSIKDTGCENNFNTVEIEGKTISFEGCFDRNDGQLARLLDKISNDRSVANIGPEDRSALSEVIAAQFARAKMRRTAMQSIANQLAASLEAADLNPGMLSIPTDRQIRQAAFFSLLKLDKLIDSLHRKRLVLVGSPVPESFWISDNPVVTRNEFPYGGHGFNDKGVEIYFPIAREFVLGLWCPSIELKIGRLLESQYPVPNRQAWSTILESVQAGIPLSWGPETVSSLNALQVYCSSRFLYAPTNEFRLAQEIITDYPDTQHVQSLVRAGSLGQGLPPKPDMPPGIWAVCFGKLSHHMLEATSWDEEADGLVFETNDLYSLQSILDDQPIEKAELYRDGIQLVQMRRVRIEILENRLPIRLRITFQDDVLNQIGRIAKARRSARKSD
jgi:Protein of unknown function (DUF4238)